MADDPGWILIYRSLINHPTFRDDVERGVFAMLLLRAQWKPFEKRLSNGRRIILQRGQLDLPSRKLATLTGWSEPKCRRYLTRLQSDALIDVSSDAGVNVVTFCNYDKYQNDPGGGDAPSDAPAETEPTRDRRATDAHYKKGKKGKEGIKEEERGRAYAFEGKIIRLNRWDFDKWSKTYHAIPDLKAELSGIDAWCDSNLDGQDRKKWFHRVSGMLNRKHQELVGANRPAPPPPASPWDGFPPYLKELSPEGRLRFLNEEIVEDEGDLGVRVTSSIPGREAMFPNMEALERARSLALQEVKSRGGA